MSIRTKHAVIHKSESRGLANHGWLVSRHTFSFAAYHNPDRINFGALRVLNDDIVKPGKGFGTHPHDNMEIVSIPVSGALAHKDSTGREQVIRTGEVQIMSAGSGIYHSEYNYSKTDDVNFLQIWVFPKERNINPRYDQRDFSAELKSNKLITVVSPVDNTALWINQDAEFIFGNLISNTSVTHELRFKGSGIYAFLVEGEAKINDVFLNPRDAAGFFDLREITIDVLKDSTILLIEVPKYY
ncbi:MAG: pirin family protein [Cytophagales bacterium]|nr:pirin family protein [Cytophagales bacterium]